HPASNACALFDASWLGVDPEPPTVSSTRVIVYSPIPEPAVLNHDPVLPPIFELILFAIARRREKVAPDHPLPVDDLSKKLNAVFLCVFLDLSDPVFHPIKISLIVFQYDFHLALAQIVGEARSFQKRLNRCQPLLSFLCRWLPVPITQNYPIGLWNVC